MYHNFGSFLCHKKLLSNNNQRGRSLQTINQIFILRSNCLRVLPNSSAGYHQDDKRTMNPWIPDDENEEAFIKNRYEDTALLLYQESKFKQSSSIKNDLFQYGASSKRSPYQTLSNGTLYVKRLNNETNVNMEITTVSIASDKSLRCTIM